MMLMPPAPDHCQQCAATHSPDQPHNQQSLYWQFWFNNTYGRSPTWADAMEHCTPICREYWTTELHRLGQQFPENHHALVKVGDQVTLCHSVKRGRTGKVRSRARLGRTWTVVSVENHGHQLVVKTGENPWNRHYTVRSWIRVTKP